MNDVDVVEVFKSSQGGDKRASIAIGAAGLGAEQIMTMACANLRLIATNNGPGRLSYWQERKAKKVMMENLDCGIQISAVAKECSLSRSHFSRAFKNATGHSPRDWLQLARLTRAKEFLEQTDFSISQVGLECGFADQSHFTRMFSSKFNMSPGKWRAREKSQLQGGILPGESIKATTPVRLSVGA
ncbi:AraC family transcriptional regulator [Pseudomonas synxantha]|uniref:AraC-like DNA-binding protein n=1 Tax=Pseudomonas synxantha TaxID=47883 RepID=A0ACC6JVD6_9PSED|nr:AraC family transcriptional regulator [Pseudomonas synxantha]MDR6610209.1 AraC-like DNA-binding protein [Pseudomonas synxantha]